MLISNVITSVLTNVITSIFGNIAQHIEPGQITWDASTIAYTIDNTNLKTVDYDGH